jgi:hypothetical protein
MTDLRKKQLGCQIGFIQGKRPKFSDLHLTILEFSAATSNRISHAPATTWVPNSAKDSATLSSEPGNSRSSLQSHPTISPLHFANPLLIA